ncbi:MAG: hypothetical protein HOH58_14460, partial [Opitutaceae bacterium]|nr:hypothetical protein [Opitutaceae bacterium]
MKPVRILKTVLLFVPLWASAQTYYSNTFESDTVGSKPVGEFSFSPSTNTSTNGFEVIDASSSPANPLGTKSVYLFDRNTGAPTHWRG